MQAIENSVIQAAGSMPLTAEQASSLRSAIMLLSEGDGLGAGLWETSEPTSDPGRDNLQRAHDDDRQAFAGMYS
jgi:hypothetical protein